MPNAPGRHKPGTPNFKPRFEKRWPTAKRYARRVNYVATKQNLPRTAEELDRRFDEGEDVESLGFDLSKAKRPALQIQRTTLDLPAHMLEKLDRQAALRGVTRQSLIKMWLFEKLELYK